MRPSPGKAPQLFELAQEGRTRVGRGVIVYARAPGYAWSLIALDVSKGGRELLLKPGAALHVRLTNVQLARYAALDTDYWLNVWQAWPDGGQSVVRTHRLDETLETEGLRLEGVEPGELIVSVKQGGVFSSEERPVLAQEEFSIAAAESRELVLALADPPSPPQRASLGGVVSLPAFGGEEKVRLQVYSETSAYRNPDVEVSLADLERVGGARPTWSFHLEDLPPGRYQLQLLPFLKSWVIELPAGGHEEVALVVPELAEMIVETVDARTGERIPLDEFYYRNQDPPPGQLQNHWAKADVEEPGRFRFWTVPGAASIWPRNQSKLGYGLASEDLDLTPGLQSVRFELPPVYAMHFEFREDGTALPVGPQGLDVRRDIRAIGHEGRVTGDGLQTDMRVEVSAPGVYEILFDSVTADRFHPIPPLRVSVRAREMTEVIVELRRK